MLSDFTPMTTLATADEQRSRDFYEGVLGFVPQEGTMDEGVVYGSGAGAFFVYPSAFAGTNRATSMSFTVDWDRFDQEVASLRDAGIAFDTFELEGLVWEDGVAVTEGMKSVWFSDPDGNILNLQSELG